MTVKLVNGDVVEVSPEEAEDLVADGAGAIVEEAPPPSPVERLASAFDLATRTGLTPCPGPAGLSARTGGLGPEGRELLARFGLGLAALVPATRGPA